METEMLRQAKKLLPKMRSIRRYLHENAEVGFDLPKTSEYVEKQLKVLGYAPKRIGRYAIMAEIGKKSSDCFLLRADMDALPMREETEEAFACKNGNMHACGHDLHTTMLLGAAALLKGGEERLLGKVRLLFQPAEELLEGAKFCIESGCLEGVTAAAMLHVLPLSQFPSGTAIVSSAGVSAPAADFFQLDVFGESCHGSSPWQGVDALLIAAKTVDGLQVLSSREFSPQIPATLTFGSFHAGTADNVLAGEARLTGTLRAFSEETRERLKRRMAEIVASTAKTYRGRAKLVFKGGCPCLSNDAELSSMLLEIAAEVLGKDRAYSALEFSKGGVGGSEDFAYISQKVPSIMVGLTAGVRGENEGQPLHSPKAQFDERAMPYGAALLASTAVEYLNRRVKNEKKKRR